MTSLKANFNFKRCKLHISPRACSSTLEESMEYLYNRNYRMTVNLIDDFIFLKKNIDYSAKLAIASSASTYGDGSKGFDDKYKNIKIINHLTHMVFRNI